MALSVCSRSPRTGSYTKDPNIDFASPKGPNTPVDPLGVVVWLPAFHLKSLHRGTRKRPDAVPYSMRRVCTEVRDRRDRL